METIATLALTTDKVIAEDVIVRDQVVVKKGSKVTELVIQKLNAFNVMGVQCFEPSDYATSYYEKIKLSKEFAAWKASYQTNMIAYKVAVDSFVYNRVPFRTEDLLNISNTLVNDKITGKRLLTYINLMEPKEEELSYVHGLNVALICKMVSKWLNLSPGDADILTLCGFIYDVGKNILPQDIIWKPGKLNAMEYDLMQTHAFHAYHLLSKTNLDQHILNTVLQHHERCDGSGYPQGLKGTEMDPFAKIVAVVDMYEAMTAPRTYRDPLCPYKAIAIFEQEFFQKYDIKFIQLFMQKLTDELIGNKVKLSDGRVGEVVMSNRTALSKPLVRFENGEVIDLSKAPNVAIEQII